MHGCYTAGRLHSALMVSIMSEAAAPASAAAAAHAVEPRCLVEANECCSCNVVAGLVWLAVCY